MLATISFSNMNQDKSNIDERESIIRFSHVVKRVTPKGIGAQMFKRLANGDESLSKEFREKFKRVEVYPESALYADEQVIDALLANKVQFAAPSLSVLCKKQDKFCEFDKFYRFKDITEVNDYQESEEGQKLKKVTTTICNDEKTNCLVGLFYWHNGMKQLSTKQECSEDQCFFMKENWTFRVQDSKTIRDDFERTFGKVIAKHIPFNKASKALEKGSVDGQENTWSNTVAEKYNKYQHCFIETNHGYLGYIVLTNTKFWNNLTESDKEVLKKHLDTATKKVNSIAKKYNKASRQLIEESNKIIQLTEKEIGSCKERAIGEISKPTTMM